MSAFLLSLACAALMLILLLGLGALIGFTALKARLQRKQIKPEIQALIRNF